MEINSLNRSVHPSGVPLERLAGSKGISQQEKIGEVSRQFEAVLLRQILGQAQKPMFKSSLMGGGGTTNAIYQDMITQQLADRISQGGTFGFAKVLEKQLSVDFGEKRPESQAELKPVEISKNETGPAVEQKIRKFKSPAIQPGKRI